MEPRKVVKEYSNGDFTVVWKPAKCVHSGICVKLLPEVYRPEEKPWIDATHASQADLRKQIDQCPSGALSYYVKGEEAAEVTAGTTVTKVEIVKNGPLLVYGTLEVCYPDGSVKEQQKRTSFCRCGASANKPFCDGSHRKIEFQD